MDILDPSIKTLFLQYFVNILGNSLKNCMTRGMGLVYEICPSHFILGTYRQVHLLQIKPYRPFMILPV